MYKLYTLSIWCRKSYAIHPSGTSRTQGIHWSEELSTEGRNLTGSARFCISKRTWRTVVRFTTRNINNLSFTRLFQLPTFFIAARALYAGPPKSQTHYPLMLAYSASSCTTTFACLVALLTSTGPTQFQMSVLLASYVPFFLVPFWMAVDMTLRLTASQQIKTLKAE